MNNTWSQQEANEAIKHVFQKATSDNEFRQLVLNDPHEAFKQVTGKDVPAEFQIKILESDPNYNITLLLPDFRDELSDGELEDVAGGGFLCGETEECGIRDVCLCDCDGHSSSGCDRD